MGYRIIKKSMIMVTNGAGLPDAELQTTVYGEYNDLEEATQALEKIPINKKYNLEIEQHQSFEEQINTDYLD